MNEQSQLRISILLTARNHYTKEIQKYAARMDKESDKLLIMHKSDSNISVQRRAKVRAKLSQMQEASNHLADRVVEINNWIAEIKALEGGE